MIRRRLQTPVMALLLACFAMWSVKVEADSLTWDGTTDGQWSDLTNWVGGAAVPGTGNTATFNNAGGAVDIIDLGGGVTISIIAFDTASAAAYTIGAGAVNSQALTLDNGSSITMSSSVAADQLINAAVTLGGGDNTFVNDSLTNSLTIAGTITGGGNLTLAGSGDGGIQDLGLSGNLIKTGSGLWSVVGTSAFTGTTSIIGGTLSINSGSIDGTTGTTLGSASLATDGNNNIGNLTLSANSLSNISLDGFISATLTIGTITRNAGATTHFDNSSTFTISTTGSGSGTKNVLWYATVDDGTATGMARISGSNIVRLATFSTLADNSDSAATDFTTFGMASNPLAWSNAITIRSVNSLTFDASAASQTVHMGAATNILTLASGAIQKINGNDATLLGGQIGADNSEVIVHQHGTGTLFLNSPISSGTGSLIKLGSGTVQLSGGISTATPTSSIAFGDTTVTVASTAGLAVGQTVTGTGITLGATIASITNGTDFVLSLPVEPGASGTPTLTFGPGSTYTGATTINAGTLQAGTSTLFTAGAATGGPIGPKSAVTLANVAGAALDVNGFTVTIGSLSGGGATGGNVLLGGGTLLVGNGNFATSSTFSGQITESGNLTVTGGGTLRLTNTSNNYTGTVNIDGGSLIISDELALGGTGTVNITSGNSTPSNTGAIGFTGGSLVLDGSAGGFTFSRDLNIEGRGPIGERGASVLSIGNNTLSGLVTGAVSAQAPATFRNSRIISSNGTLTLSSALTTQGTAASTFTSLGGINTAGVGNFTFGGTGTLTGSGSIEKSGGCTLFLNSLASNAGFTGTVRISGGATLTQSSVRVETLDAGGSGSSIFGGNTGTNASSAIDMNGGVLEFRNDGSLDFNSLSSGKNVYWRASSTYYTGPAVGGSGVNGTTTLGALRVASNTTGTLNSRNGFGFSFGTWTQENSNNNVTLNNNMGGTLTFRGNVWNNSDGSARTLTFGGNGNTTILGSINTSGAGVKTLTKTGSGALTIAGTATTLNGPVNVQGSLVITDFRSINNNTSAITLGNATTTSGNLIIGTSGTPSAAGLITSKPIVLAGTTASQSIYANQTGANPVILNGAITRNGTITTGLVILGGTNTADNTVNVAIPEQGTGGVRKVGAGTWVLAATNGYNDVTTIANGTLKLKADAAVSTILGATNDITFANINGFSGATLELVGQDGINNVQTLDVLASNDGANTLKLTPGAGGTASFVFTSRSVTDDASLNIVGSDASNTVTICGLTAGALIDRVYFGGNEFATSTGGVLRAPIYGTDAAFETSATVLTATDTNEITGSFSTPGAIIIDALKINGAHTLTLTGALSVRTGTNNTDGSILATGGASTITGSTLSTNTVAATGSMSFRVDTGSTLTVESVMNNFSGGLTKSGEGILILAADNTNTGTVSINEGTIRLSGAGSDLGGAAALVIRDGAVLDLNGVTPTSNTNAFTNAGQVINSGALATFTVGGSNGTGTSFGTVDGAISLTKVGTGAQSWLGSSTYTGVTTIGSTGLVTVDTLADGGIASGIGASASAASNLVFNGSTGGLRYDGNIRNGDLVLGSRSTTTDRLFTLAGTGATLQSNVGNNNGIVWSNTGAIVHGIVGPQGLIFRGTSTGDNTFNPQLTDSGSGTDITSLTKTDAGQWNLGNSNNTYTGITTINNGVLALNDNGALPANSPVVLTPTSATSPAILQMSGTFDRNLTAAPTAGTGDVNFGFSIASTSGGAGFAAHTTELVVAIGGIGTPTALTWGSGGFVGTGGVQNLALNSTSALSSVDFRNAIDLGAANRTINVLDNTNTGADFAQISGVLSGAGGSLTKRGNGVLKMTGENTYTGSTTVLQGSLVVSSLGSSTDAASTPTSVGISGVAMDATNAIILGNVGNAGGLLQYVGVGETSDRLIQLNVASGSGNSQIHADGTGPLILTNVVNVAADTNPLLFLRGTNTAGNVITSVLSDNGNPFGVTVDGSATWILTNANTYTGNTTSSAGALGIGNDSAIGTGTLVMSNGNIFAYGADRTIANTLQINTATSHGFLGDYSLTFTSAVAFNASTSSSNFTNNSIATGKALIFAGGVVANSLTASRNWNFDGPGETIINGNFTTSTAFGVNLIKNGNGILNLGTSGATSNWNQAGNNVDVDRGTLKFTANNAIPTLATSGGLTISPEVATTDTATVDLNGTTQTVNALTMNTDGTAVIDNTSATAATLRVGANNAAVSIGGGIGTYTVTDSGAGALSLVKLGTATATITTGVTLTYQGSTGVEGGTLTIASPVNGTTGLSVTNSGSMLALTGGITAPSAITSVVVEDGDTLSLLDGVGTQLNMLTTLQLGSTGGTMTTLNLNVGDVTNPDMLATDTLTILTGGTLSLFAGNQITFNLTDAGLNGSSTYNLIDVTDGGLTLGALGLSDWILGATPGGFTSVTLNKTDTLISITTGTLITGDLFWRGSAGGGTDDSWNANVNNWSQDKANTSVATYTPGQGTDVIFAIDSATGAVATTLEQNFKINSLTFEAGATTPTSVTIAPGAVSTNRLEIAPQVATDGIAITVGGPAAVTISAPLKIGANQTWTVADSASVLTLSGGLQGEADVTKAGAGKVILGAAADPTFNSGVTSDFTINAGTLELTDVGALGNPTNANFATVTVNSGGAFYYNGVASTATNLAMPITLNGGTLSLGGANQLYSGPVNLTADSFINLADSNGPTTNAARNLSITGVFSGSNAITVNSTQTASVNDIAGVLIFDHNVSNVATNVTSGFTGDINIEAGSVLYRDMRVADSNYQTTGAINFKEGKLYWDGGLGGDTLAMTNRDITIANGATNAYGELSVDRGTGTGVFAVSFDAASSITLGDAAGGTG